MTPPPIPPPVYSLRSRKAIVLALVVPLCPAFIVLMLQRNGVIDVEDFGFAENTFYIVTFAIIFLGLMPIFVTWRCPICRKYLGKELHPPCCPACGARFE